MRNSSGGARILSIDTLRDLAAEEANARTGALVASRIRSALA